MRNQWQSVAIIRNQWPPCAISGHHAQSVAISRHQTSSMHLGHICRIRFERPPIPKERFVKFTVHLQSIGQVVGRSRVVRCEAQHLWGCRAPW